MEEIIFASGSVPVAVAARVYGKDASWIRAGIVSGWLPIGKATRSGKLVTNLEEMNSKYGRMENVWGNLWRRTAGWINANGTQKVKLTRGTHDGSTAADYNTDGSGYISVANASPHGNSGGYIDTMKTEAYGRLPVTANGSSSTYEADGMWFNNSQVNYACVGGRWADALLVGPFCAYLATPASDSGSNVGAALSCKPLAAA